MSRRSDFGQRLGNELEKRIHYWFSSHGLKCYRESDVTKLYGIDITGIDHMIVYGNKTVYVQDKWSDRLTNIHQAHHFIQCVDKVSAKRGSEFKAIYVSKTKPSHQAIKAFFDKGHISINGSNTADVISSLTSEILSFFNINDSEQQQMVNNYCNNIRIVHEKECELRAEVTELYKLIVDYLKDSTMLWKSEALGYIAEMCRDSLINKISSLDLDIVYRYLDEARVLDSQFKKTIIDKMNAISWLGYTIDERMDTNKYNNLMCKTSFK